MKLYIVGLVLIIAGCTGYQVIYTCDNYHCFNQAVLPGQKIPDEFVQENKQPTPEQCNRALNLLRRHEGIPLVDGPEDCF